MACQITSLTIVYLTMYSGAEQSSASLAFVRGIHRSPVNSQHKKPVTWIMFPFDDVKLFSCQNHYVITLIQGFEGAVISDQWQDSPAFV